MKKVVFILLSCSVVVVPPVPAACPSMDVTRDCFVDLADFAVFTGHWMTGNRLPEDMVSLPAGTFQMGNSKDELEGKLRELPVHTVTLESYAMGRYEITNGQYCAFLNSAYPTQLKVVNGIVYAIKDKSNSFPYCDTMLSNSYSQIAFLNNTFLVRAKGPKFSARDMSKDPMVRVRWYGAVAYCNWRSQQEGKQTCYNLSTWNCDFTQKSYRLPTEAEWEYAARGVLSGKRFPWGESITHNQANYWSWIVYSYDTGLTRQFHPTWNDGFEPYTSPVGSFPANGYGLCDMAGNASEWCNDWYGDYNSSSQMNPTGPATGGGRVFRDGSWDREAFQCRVSYRDYEDSPDFWWANTIGFRVVLVLN